MNVAYFALGEDAQPRIEQHGRPVKSFSCLEDFNESGESPDGIVIRSSNPALSEQLIRKLRGTTATCIVPIVLLEDHDPGVALLADGQAPDVPAALKKMEPILSRMAEVPAEVLELGQDFRLLAYLYTRPEKVLSTDRQWHHERVHSYPVAESLADPNTDIDRWLSNLEERRYLEHAGLLDRVRLCPNCGGCHHNFVDACPESRSIDIVQKPFLHCFTCGHVAPEENFLSGDSLVCPNCLSRLRHIGTDYDRPLENYVCRDCGRSFIEPTVIARCLSCGAENAPEALIPRQVYAYRLAERGILAARTGSLEDIYALFDNLNYIRPQFFESLVDWLMAICNRHGEERFSLLGIRLSNILELTDRIGRYRTSELVDEFASRLREAIRKTDLTTRTSRSILWILLPKTDHASCRVLVSRLEKIRANTRQPEGLQIDFDMVTFSAPRDMIPGEPARLLLPRLMGDSE